MRWPEVMLRLALIAGLIAALMYDVPVWITAPLGLIAIAASAELAIRPYAANVADRLLLGCGATVTALILAGLALNLTPWGLTRATWSVAWLVVSTSSLIWRRGSGTKVQLPTAWIKSPGIWMVAASLILIAAGVLAVAGVRQWDRRPTLALSIISNAANTIVVEIDATSVSGQYKLTATSNAPQAAQYSGAALSIRTGSAGERLRERVPVNTPGPWTISLVSASDGSIVRSLKVNPS